LSLITNLNLSTHPFRNRVLPYLLSAMMLIVAAFSLIVFLSWLNENSEENARLRALIAERESAIKQLKGEGEKIQQQLTPEQKAVLTAAHKLVANKQFGWSRLFADLESVMPGSVSASRIVVQNIYTDGDRVKAEVEMGVLSRDYQSVMTMIQSMQNSGHFQAELRGQDFQKTDRMTFTEYTLRLIYSPSYTVSEPSTTGDVAQSVQGGER
jgi:Tfp pilus assembly protein PilN